MARTRREKDYCAIAQQYVEQVLSGEIPACEWVKRSCERQAKDLQCSGFAWRFDRDLAARVCRFFELLPHVKGRWKSKTLILEPWQCFLLTTIFGWVDREGHRRFRKALIATPRKNGKSSLAAGIGLYLLALDGEPGAEVFSAATSRDQAKISWELAKRQAAKLPRFCEQFGIEPLSHSIAIEDQAAFFKPLSRDADSLEGLNVHGAIIDELHAHKTREVFDVLDEATGSRRQPLLFIISTEGDSNEGVFPEQVDYARRVLSGQLDDDTYFALLYTIDADDDWTQPSSWQKANPNFNISVFENDLRVRCKQALANPHSQASFLTKRLNVRVGAGSAYFNMLAWDRQCKDESMRMEDFAGSPCVIAIDLASKRDLTAKMIVFHRDDAYYVFGRYYLPEDAIAAEQPNHELYRGWATSEALVLTPGNITDYEFLERDLLDDVEKFRPRHVGVDPNYNASHFTTRMQAQNVPMIDVPHTVASFTEPMKTLEAMIAAGRIRHNGDPVLAWALGNVVARRDAKDNVYPRKSRDQNKIDPVVALIANLSLQLRGELIPELKVSWI